MSGGYGCWFSAWKDHAPVLWHRYERLEYGVFVARCGARVDTSVGLHGVLTRPADHVCPECEKEAE